MSQGFVDLRANSGGGEEGSGSFWPSFTDIMMVVVMIFMLASTVLVLRNYELVTELRSTMEAEKEASRMAQMATATNASLEEQLYQTQYMVSELRMKLMQREEANEMMTQMLQDQDKQLTALNENLLVTRNNLQNQTAIAEQVQKQFDESDIMRKQLAELLSQEQSRYGDIRQRLENLQRKYDQRNAEYQTLEQQANNNGQRLSIMQGKYDQLKVEYDKLVRPARTAKGKFVVDVRYEKPNNVDQIQYRLNGSGAYTQTSLEDLHKLLTKIKKEKNNQLYIKVIIPEDSGLSYNEAWNFTKDVLEKYDYYYE